MLMISMYSFQFIAPALQIFLINVNCVFKNINNVNISNFFQHSCSPNVFVQNVFVDTHDLRFPWVAFFAYT